MNSYTELKTDHEQLRGLLGPEENAELDAMRDNGMLWDKLRYAAGAVILGTIGFLLIFA